MGEGKRRWDEGGGKGEEEEEVTQLETGASALNRWDWGDGGGIM